jgi:hypothetical protein
MSKGGRKQRNGWPLGGLARRRSTQQNMPPRLGRAPTRSIGGHSFAAALAAAKSAKCSVLVCKLDPLSRDVAFVSGLMAQRVPFVVA